LLFSRTPADFTLLEVGVGGRLDATNVIHTPLVTGITSISLDHQSDLGDTVEAIAFEKAGIIKPGIPVAVAADLAPSVRDVIVHVAQAQNAPVNVAKGIGNSLNLPGEHQRINAGLAVQMIELAGITCRNIEQSLQNVVWRGRLQRLMLAQGGIWLDGAHNEAGAKALAHSLQQLDTRPWMFFIHIKARKDAASMLKHFASVASSFYFVGFPIEGGESVPPSELVQLSAELGICASILLTMDDMFDIIQRTDESMVASGSLFFVGSILSCNN
jgi:dihydrofolate synthase/folylpolyglutamate synthase